jgi:hypothetical protein
MKPFPPMRRMRMSGSNELDFGFERVTASTASRSPCGLAAKTVFWQTVSFLTPVKLSSIRDETDNTDEGILSATG